jgi:3-oxoacyl-[acyl-carrier-protein] synthase II
MKRRVGITGIGIVSSLGFSTAQNWERLRRRESGISRVEFQGHEAFPHCNCGGITEFDPAEFVQNKKLLKLMNREAQLAFSAAGQALEHSDLRGRCAPDRMGVFLGTGLTTGDLESLVPIVERSIDEGGEFSYSRLGATALTKCNPLLSFKILPNMALSYISIEHNLRGPNMVFNPWPGNTVQAILEAARAIELGEIDCALTGGCDSKCTYVSFLTLSHLGLLSEKGRAVPFSSDADGTIPGEGAACLVLESFEHAERRKAPIFAELCGGACVTDWSSGEAYPTTPVHLVAAMQGALDKAGVTAPEVDLICSSAASHPVGDERELNAMKQLFEASDPAITALSEFTGDLFAAGPAYALGMGAYSFTQTDTLPLLPFGVTHRGREISGQKKITTALINAFSAGTSKASIVIRNVIH